MRLEPQSVPSADLGRTLIERYSASGSNHMRKQVLELWSRLDINDTARRDLIDRIVIPMLGLNLQATELATDYVEQLCVPFPPENQEAARRCNRVSCRVARVTRSDRRKLDGDGLQREEDSQGSSALASPQQASTREALTTERG